MKNNMKRHIPWGRTLTTNDNYLGRQKTNSKKTRGVVVIETDDKNNLAVVPLSSTDGVNRTELKGYNKSSFNKNKKQVKTYFKHYLEIEDNEGKPIRVNEKFRENHKNMDVPHKDVEFIRDTLFKKARTKQYNVKQYDKFKKRK